MSTPDFQYQAQSWDRERRVIAKIEWHPGELFPRLGFIVTNLPMEPGWIVKFYNRRGTAEQHIKEGKYALLNTFLLEAADKAVKSPQTPYTQIVESKLQNTFAFNYISRFANESVCLGNRVIPEGDKLSLEISNAASKTHLNFGIGRHACIGKGFTKSFLSIALPILVDFLKDHRVSSLELTYESSVGYNSVRDCAPVYYKTTL